MELKAEILCTILIKPTKATPGDTALPLPLSALLHYADEEFNRAVDCFHSDMLVVAVDGAALFGIVNKSLLP